MAFCANCGNQLDDGVVFCPNCGKAAPAAQPVVAQAPVSNNNASSDLWSSITNTPDTTAEQDPADVNANKAMGILAYIGILCLIPIFAAKDSKFARFHANQGLVLLITSAILGAVSSTLMLITFWIGAWWLGTLLCLPISAISVGLAVLGIINAAKGKTKELPFIGKFKILK